jgi:uncharacterized protein YhhL (DUF1145 family)
LILSYNGENYWKKRSQMLSSLAKYSIIVFGIYHLVAGAFALAPHKWLQSFSWRVYKLKIPEVIDAKYFLAVKFLGLMAWMVAGSSWVISCFSDERARALILILFSFLFLGRAILRWLFKAELKEAYHLDDQRNLKNIIFNICLSFYAFVLGWVNL